MMGTADRMVVKRGDVAVLFACILAYRGNVQCTQTAITVLIRRDVYDEKGLGIMV